MSRVIHYCILKVTGLAIQQSTHFSSAIPLWYGGFQRWKTNYKIQVRQRMISRTLNHNNYGLGRRHQLLQRYSVLFHLLICRLTITKSTYCPHAILAPAPKNIKTTKIVVRLWGKSLIFNHAHAVWQAWNATNCSFSSMAVGLSICKNWPSIR